MLLRQREIPVVVQISSSTPYSLGNLSGRASVLMRPVDPRSILETLLKKMGKSEMRVSNALASRLKQV
jgi:hypothetical protein